MTRTTFAVLVTALIPALFPAVAGAQTPAPAPRVPVPKACIASDAPLVCATRRWSTLTSQTLERKCRPAPVFRWRALEVPVELRLMVAGQRRTRYIRALSGMSVCVGHLDYWLRFYFGARWLEAKDVVRCETGGTFWTGATNGQFRGLFQMGDDERAKYGHGSTARAQVAAAHRYFVDTGSDWSPWQCRPFSGLAW